MESSDLGGRNQIGMRNLKYMCYFIGASLAKTASGCISRRTLDTYSTEFQLGIVKKIIIEGRLGFSVVSIFCSRDAMSDGRGDGYSSNSARWRRNSFHQPLASTGCDLTGGIVVLGNFSALHVGTQSISRKSCRDWNPLLALFL